MRVEILKSSAEKASFESVNQIIKVDISKNNGPELYLYDGSIIIFANSSQFSKLLCNSRIYTVSKTGIMDFDIDKFYSLYFDSEDDTPEVTYRNKDVYRVEQYIYENEKVYRLFT